MSGQMRRGEAGSEDVGSDVREDKIARRKRPCRGNVIHEEENLGGSSSGMKSGRE